MHEFLPYSRQVYLFSLPCIFVAVVSPLFVEKWRDRVTGKRIWERKNGKTWENMRKYGKKEIWGKKSVEQMHPHIGRENTQHRESCHGWRRGLRVRIPALRPSFSTACTWCSGELPDLAEAESEALPFFAL